MAGLNIDMKQITAVASATSTSPCVMRVTFTLSPVEWVLAARLIYVRFTPKKAGIA
jgi:hypothetical protein